jgi:hypothetical protein
MKYRNLLLHTCWSIFVGCWNSNSEVSILFDLNSFQIPKPLNSKPLTLPLSSSPSAFQPSRPPQPAQLSAAAQQAAGRYNRRSRPVRLAFRPSRPASAATAPRPRACAADGRGPRVIPPAAPCPTRTRPRPRRHREFDPGTPPPRGPHAKAVRPGLFKAVAAPWTSYPSKPRRPLA